MFRRVGERIGHVLPSRATETLRPIWFDFVERAGTELIRDPTGVLMIAPSGVCNLGCKFCAYRHKDRPKRIMPDEKFFGVVDQATQLGYSTFGLTPLTGEVYTDPDLLTKLEFMEAHPGVESYYFFSNLTLASHEDLRATFTDCETFLRGSRSLFVSVYGHDRESFLAITDGEDRHYETLVSNLEFLADFLPAEFDDCGNVEVGFRTYDSADPLADIDSASGDRNRLLDAVRDLRAAGVTVSDFSGDYNNWGGTVTAGDLEGLDMEIGDAQVQKNGPCQLIFNKNIVLPDGTVNACACRDVNATLALGDTDDRSLAEILSPSHNENYRALIDRQDADDFPDVCETCDFYQSIRGMPVAEGYTVEEFAERFDPMTEGYEPKPSGQ